MEQDDYSLINVVHHMKDAIQKTYGDNFLVLEYKWAKANQSTQGNLKFQKILQKSHEKTMVMNSNKEMKKKPYVHLRSMTQEEQFKWLLINLKMLHKTHPMNVNKHHKIDFKFQGNKISFDSQTMKWTYKNTYLLFRPNYETVKNGKLFRISLTSQFKGIKQPKKKVINVLRDAINEAIKCNNELKFQTKEKVQNKFGLKDISQEKRKTDQIQPFRFKQQTTYELNKCCSIVMSKVYQVVNLKMYEQILGLVNNQKNSQAQSIGKTLLSEMVTEVFEQFKKELTYEVEMRFSPKLVEEFEDMYDEEIQQIMQKAAVIFINLFKDPHEFSPEQVIENLESL